MLSVIVAKCPKTTLNRIRHRICHEHVIMQNMEQNLHGVTVALTERADQLIQFCVFITYLSTGTSKDVLWNINNW